MKNCMKLFALYLVLSISFYTAHAQGETIKYKESKEDFPNPERGFYIPAETHASHFVPLEASHLRTLCAGPQKHGSASYEIYATVLLRGYVLDLFRDGPLSQEFLNGVDQDLAAIRDAGLKVILRFSYINKTHSGDCPDKEKICPPYGDASKAVVLGHIGQLKPLFEKYVAVIVLVQEGFIGVWGENFYTDHFGDASGNGPGRIMDESWKDRNEVLNALLEALPKDRMVQVRTPQIKQKYVYGPGAGVNAGPLSAREAFSFSHKSRIGFHNDCFLSSPDDYGTFYDYGSTNSPKKEANAELRKYLEEDSRYTPVGGETCDDAYSPQNDCAPAGHAEEEMAAMHYSFLNTAYNNNVNNDWDSAGCMNSIRKKLGYRFVLREAYFPEHAVAGHMFAFNIHLENVGYASPFNPRPAILILRNLETGKEYPIKCRADIRTWFSGGFDWREMLNLPANMTAGKYSLYLNFPDKFLTLTKRPEYSIRLANEDCWEESTGYNRLNCIMTVLR